MSTAKDIDINEVLEGLVESLEQTLDHERTGKPYPRTRVIKRRVVDIPALRKRYRMTQQQFADAFGISIGTLRGWEQGRRSPDGPARLLLMIIEDRPDVAAEVLRNHELADDEVLDFSEKAKVTHRKNGARVAPSMLNSGGVRAKKRR